MTEVLVVEKPVHWFVLKSMDCFLYNRDWKIQKVLHSNTPRVCFCMLFCFCFFSVWLFFHEYSRFTGQQVKGEAISLYPFYHFHPLHRHLDISWVIAAESSPLRITGNRNRTRKLWYTLFRIHSSYAGTGVVGRMVKTLVTLGNISRVL